MSKVNLFKTSIYLGPTYSKTVLGPYCHYPYCFLKKQLRCIAIRQFATVCLVFHFSLKFVFVVMYSTLSFYSNTFKFIYRTVNKYMIIFIYAHIIIHIIYMLVCSSSCTCTYFTCISTSLGSVMRCAGRKYCLLLCHTMLYYAINCEYAL